MNWFERYGIPGIYFVLLLGILEWIFLGILPTKDTALAVFGVAFSASIPIGYILVILSQLMYYMIPSWQVFSKAWSKAGKGEKRRAEWWVEAEAAILARVRGNNNGVEKGKWVQDWSMKRFDVLAINRSLLLATIFGIILDIAGFLTLIPVYRMWIFWKVLVFFVICVVILVILTCNSYVLKKQAIRVHEEYYKVLRSKISETTSNTTKEVSDDSAK